jgi:two-component system, cell cycle response regulator DivK
MITILYIEDEPHIAELVRRRLGRAGYEVILARNDTEAEQQLAACRPRVILIDIGLGETGRDGWEIQERLKADPDTRDIPAIALTAQNPTEDDRNEALRRGFIDHVPKPVDWEVLELAIKEAISREGGAA